ncbi:hypothetical protein VTH82DRAFT_3483 [Thermothelomyces myriococcoides]
MMRDHRRRSPESTRRRRAERRRSREQLAAAAAAALAERAMQSSSHSQRRARSDSSSSSTSSSSSSSSSTSSSLLNISRKSRFGIRSFFASSSVKKVKKRRSFRRKNTSSSSFDSDLAYGPGYVSRSSFERQEAEYLQRHPQKPQHQHQHQHQHQYQQQYQQYQHHQHHQPPYHPQQHPYPYPPSQHSYSHPPQHPQHPQHGQYPSQHGPSPPSHQHPHHPPEQDQLFGPDGRPALHRAETDEEILALGRKLSDLARAQNIRDLERVGKKRPSRLVAAATALSEFHHERKSRHGHTSKGHGSSKLHSRRDESDTEWESTSDSDSDSDSYSESSSDADSSLAYGPTPKFSDPTLPIDDRSQHRPLPEPVRPPHHKSSAVDPAGSRRGHTDSPHGFRPGDSPRSSHRETDPRASTYEIPPPESASIEARPMRRVYPVPAADDAARFEAAPGSSGAPAPVATSEGSSTPTGREKARERDNDGGGALYSSRPEPVPIQAPRPRTLVSPRVLEDSRQPVEREQLAEQAGSPPERRSKKSRDSDRRNAVEAVVSGALPAVAGAAAGAALASVIEERREKKREEHRFERREERRSYEDRHERQEAADWRSSADAAANAVPPSSAASDAIARRELEELRAKEASVREERLRYEREVQRLREARELEERESRREEEEEEEEEEKYRRRRRREEEEAERRRLEEEELDPRRIRDNPELAEVYERRVREVREIRYKEERRSREEQRIVRTERERMSRSAEKKLEREEKRKLESSEDQGERSREREERRRLKGKDVAPVVVDDERGRSRRPDREEVPTPGPEENKSGGLEPEESKSSREKRRAKREETLRKLREIQEQIELERKRLAELDAGKEPPPPPAAEKPVEAGPSTSRKDAVDPFKYQVPDDAFPTPAHSPPQRPLTPVIYTVESEPDWAREEARKSDDEPEERLSRRCSYEREQKAAQASTGQTLHSTIQDEKDSEARRARSRSREPPRPRDSEPVRDPVQEEANRLYRESRMAQRKAEEEIRSRTPSPTRSVVDKYEDDDDLNEDPIGRIVTPPEMKRASTKSKYDGPNADVRIDNIITPHDLHRFQPPPPDASGLVMVPIFKSRDPSCERERPMLNLVLPTPRTSPSLEKMKARQAAAQAAADEATSEDEKKTQEKKPAQDRKPNFIIDRHGQVVEAPEDYATGRVAESDSRDSSRERPAIKLRFSGARKKNAWSNLIAAAVADASAKSKGEKKSESIKEAIEKKKGGSAWRSLVAAAVANAGSKSKGEKSGDAKKEEREEEAVKDNNNNNNNNNKGDYTAGADQDNKPRDAPQPVSEGKPEKTAAPEVRPSSIEAVPEPAAFPAMVLIATPEQALEAVPDEALPDTQPDAAAPTKVSEEPSTPPRWSRVPYEFDDEPPQVGPKPSFSPESSSKVPGSYEEDAEFTATLAAGLQSSGFNPDIVIQDPTYRKRDSPPGSDEPKYVPPSCETVTDLGVETLHQESTSGKGHDAPLLERVAPVEEGSSATAEQGEKSGNTGDDSNTALTTEVVEPSVEPSVAEADDEWSMRSLTDSRKQESEHPGSFDSTTYSNPPSEVSVASSSSRKKKKNRRRSSTKDTYDIPEKDEPPDRPGDSFQWIDREVSSVASDPTGKTNGTSGHHDANSVVSLHTNGSGEHREQLTKNNGHSEEDSFLGNAGTFGAGAGYAGAVAVAAAAAQLFRPNATQDSVEEAQPFRRPRSFSYSSQIVDPEVVQREIKPAIDPQYRDLLPLPPSEPGSPKFLNNLDEEEEHFLPPLPDSDEEPPLVAPAHSPQQKRPRRATVAHPHARRRSIIEIPKTPSSSTAVPVQFRIGRTSLPSSPVFFRFSPTHSPVGSDKKKPESPDSASPRRGRFSRPTSWDSTRDFKPLYLLEKTAGRAEPEVYPELPPSEPSSRESPGPSESESESESNTDKDGQDDGLDYLDVGLRVAAGMGASAELLQALHIDTTVGKGLDHGAGESAFGEPLGSGDTTPRAAVPPSPPHSLDAPLKELSAQGEEVRPEQQQQQQQQQLVEELETLPPLPDSPADSPTWAPSSPAALAAVTSDVAPAPPPIFESLESLPPFPDSPPASPHVQDSPSALASAPVPAPTPFMDDDKALEQLPPLPESLPTSPPLAPSSPPTSAWPPVDEELEELPALPQSSPASPPLAPSPPVSAQLLPDENLEGLPALPESLPGTPRVHELSSVDTYLPTAEELEDLPPLPESLPTSPPLAPPSPPTSAWLPADEDLEELPALPESLPGTPCVQELRAAFD